MRFNLSTSLFALLLTLVVLLSVDASNTTFTGTATWYSGGDMDDAYCFGRNGLPDYTPHNNNMIAAVKQKHINLCYHCLKVTRGSRSVIVKVVDMCVGCASGNDIDLSQGAFKKLGSLGTGELKISWTVVQCPKSGSWPLKPSGF